MVNRTKKQLYAKIPVKVTQNELNEFFLDHLSQPKRGVGAQINSTPYAQIKGTFFIFLKHYPDTSQLIQKQQDNVTEFTRGNKIKGGIM